MAQTATRAKSTPLPQHEHAADHKVLRAFEQYRTPRRLKLVRRPCAEVAAERIREFAWDLGADLEWNRWMAEVSRRMGMNYDSVRQLIHGKKQYVGPGLVDQISQATGIPVSVFYDEET